MKRSERTCQTLSILAGAARIRQSLAYADLSNMIDVPAAGLGDIRTHSVTLYRKEAARH